MTFPHVIILFVSAVLGGTLNAVAGGGSFFTFPALYLVGVLPIPANATSTLALWPGAIASTAAYRRELAQQKRGLLFLLIGTSLIGGMLGALLLLKISQATFVHLIPYLLLIATLLFTFSGPVTARLRKRNVEKTHTSPFRGRYLGEEVSRRGVGKQAPSFSCQKSRAGTSPRPYDNQIPTLERRTSRTTLFGITLAQLVTATYGGFFGGGMSILMLATLAMMGMENIHEMNAVKTLLNACVNAAAIIAFIFAGVIVWQEAILMVIGAIIGGYGGAYYARQIDQKWVRLFVIVIGFGLTVYFFMRQL